MTNLTIQTLLQFGEENGAIKISAIKCILDHLHQGDADMDLRIILKSATPDAVLFFVEYGGAEPAFFYYNEPDRPEESPFISVAKKGSKKFTPSLFVKTINMLLKIDAT